MKRRLDLSREGVVTTVTTVASAASIALGEGLGGHGAAALVLDGDGLDGRGRGQGEGLAVERAFSRGRAAVGGVVHAGVFWAAHGHLCRLSERC